MDGFKFISRGSKLFWCHANEVQPTDVDCTDMDDAAFEAHVCRTIGIFAFAPVAAC